MTAARGDWTGRMLLIWTVQGAQPTGEHETIAIEPDGTTWLWVGIPADPERGDAVGTFRTRAPDDRLAAAREVAARLADLPEAAGDTHRGRVTVSAGDAARVLALHGSTGAAGDAVRLGRGLASVAFGEPIAAIRFEARFAPAPDVPIVPGVDPESLPAILRPTDGPSGLLAVVLHGLGGQPSGVVVDGDRLQAHWRSGGAAVGWTELPAPDVGLVGSGLSGGLRAPARIPPGSSPAISVRASIPETAPDAVAVRVRGMIELVGPWDSPGVPSTPFDARTRPVPLKPRTG